MAAALGILGGMGPLASARFLRTVYEMKVTVREQDMPRILLDSDPAIPDRTTAVLAGPAAVERVTAVLAARLRGLLDGGADRVVVACFTAHHFLDGIDAHLRRPVLSLIDRAVADLRTTPGRLLLLATDGTRAARVFERARHWPTVAERVVLPEGADQSRVHRMVYELKRGGSHSSALTEVGALVRRHGCTGVVLGCTELHLVWPQLVARYGRRNVVDALLSIAEKVPTGAWERPDGTQPLESTAPGALAG
jgi:aspartate racemase